VKLFAVQERFSDLFKFRRRPIGKSLDYSLLWATRTLKEYIQKRYPLNNKKDEKHLISRLFK
jgi:hypothetical protein